MSSDTDMDSVDAAMENCEVEETVRGQSVDITGADTGARADTQIIRREAYRKIFQIARVIYSDYTAWIQTAGTDVSFADERVGMYGYICDEIQGVPNWHFVMPEDIDTLESQVLENTDGSFMRYWLETVPNLDDAIWRCDRCNLCDDRTYLCTSNLRKAHNILTSFGWLVYYTDKIADLTDYASRQTVGHEGGNSRLQVELDSLADCLSLHKVSFEVQTGSLLVVRRLFQTLALHFPSKTHDCTNIYTAICRSIAESIEAPMGNQMDVHVAGSTACERMCRTLHTRGVKVSKVVDTSSSDLWCRTGVHTFPQAFAGSRHIGSETEVADVLAQLKQG